MSQILLIATRLHFGGGNGLHSVIRCQKGMLLYVVLVITGRAGILALKG